MPKPTELYLIRHGETDYNIRSVVQGQLIDCPLNEKGREQAGRLSDALAGVRIDAFYSSPLRRAVETAKIVFAPHGNPELTLIGDLMEMSFGELEGQPYGGKNEQLFADLGKRWCSGVFSDRPGGGESILDVQRRSIRSIEKIVMQNPGRTVAVVTHGRLLRVLLSTLLDGYSLETMEKLLHRNTAYSRIVVDNGNFEPLLLATDEHLSDSVPTT